MAVSAASTSGQRVVHITSSAKPALATTRSSSVAATSRPGRVSERGPSGTATTPGVTKNVAAGAARSAPNTPAEPHTLRANDATGTRETAASTSVSAKRAPSTQIECARLVVTAKSASAVSFTRASSRCRMPWRDASSSFSTTSATAAATASAVRRASVRCGCAALTGKSSRPPSHATAVTSATPTTAATKYPSVGLFTNAGA